MNEGYVYFKDITHWKSDKRKSLEPCAQIVRPREFQLSVEVSEVTDAVFGKQELDWSSSAPVTAWHCSMHQIFFHVCEHVVSLNHFPRVIMNLYLIRLNKALARLVTQNGKVQIRTLKPPRCDDEKKQRAHEAFRALMTGGQQGAGDRKLMQPATRDCRCTIM